MIFLLTIRGRGRQLLRSWVHRSHGTCRSCPSHTPVVQPCHSPDSVLSHLEIRALFAGSLVLKHRMRRRLTAPPLEDFHRHRFGHLEHGHHAFDWQGSQKAAVPCARIAANHFGMEFARVFPPAAAADRLQLIFRLPPSYLGRRLSRHVQRFPLIFWAISRQVQSVRLRCLALYRDW